MKKVFAVLAIASMVSFAACKNASKEAEKTPEVVTEEAIVVEEVEEVPAEEVVEEPAK